MWFVYALLAAAAYVTYDAWRGGGVSKLIDGQVDAKGQPRVDGSNLHAGIGDHPTIKAGGATNAPTRDVPSTL